MAYPGLHKCPPVFIRYTLPIQAHSALNIMPQAVMIFLISR